MPVTAQSLPDPAAMESQLQQALRSWGDVNTAKGLLTDLVLFHDAHRGRAATPRQANNQVLQTALTQLRQNTPVAADLIERRFLDGWPVDRVANRLNYAESTVLRHQREAIAALDRKSVV